MDDAEVKQKPQNVEAQHADRERNAKIIVESIWSQMHNGDMVQRNMKPTKLYIGYEEFDTLRAWSLSPQYLHRDHENNETMFGMKLHKVNEKNHLHVTWEKE